MLALSKCPEGNPSSRVISYLIILASSLRMVKSLFEKKMARETAFPFRQFWNCKSKTSWPWQYSYFTHNTVPSQSQNCKKGGCIGLCATGYPRFSIHVKSMWFHTSLSIVWTKGRVLVGHGAAKHSFMLYLTFDSSSYLGLSDPFISFRK